MLTNTYSFSIYILITIFASFSPTTLGAANKNSIWKNYKDDVCLKSIKELSEKDRALYKELCFAFSLEDSHSAIKELLNKLDDKEIAIAITLTQLFRQDRVLLKMVLHALLETEMLKKNPGELFSNPIYFSALSTVKKSLLSKKVGPLNKEEEIKFSDIKKIIKNTLYKENYAFDVTNENKTLTLRGAYGKPIEISNEKKVLWKIEAENYKKTLGNETLVAARFNPYEPGITMVSEGGWITNWKEKSNSYFSFCAYDDLKPCEAIVNFMPAGIRQFYLYCFNDQLERVYALSPAAYIVQEFFSRQNKITIELTQCKKKDFSKSFFLFDLKEEANKEFKSLGLPCVKSKKINGNAFDLSR